MRVKRNECFISHCSDDKEIMENFSHLIHSICHSKCFFFNTFEEENAILAGDGRADEIKRHLKNSKLMIAMITDNYVRSAICLSELSTFWFTSKNIIPILFNPKTGIKLLTDIFGKDIIYINAEDSSSKAAAKFLKTLKSNGIELKVDE